MYVLLGQLVTVVCQGNNLTFWVAVQPYRNTAACDEIDKTWGWLINRRKHCPYRQYVHFRGWRGIFGTLANCMSILTISNSAWLRD